MFLRKDPMKRARPPEVSQGAEVFSADGDSLGVVSELNDVSFKVNTNMAPDYWLGRDYVIEATPERVSMSFMKSELGAYRLAQPGMTAETDTTQEALSDRIVPLEDQANQRMQMARELAEQRQRLPHTHPDGEDAPPETMGGTIGEPVEEELRDMGVEPRDARANDERADGERWSPSGSFVEPAEPTGTAGDAASEDESPRPDARPKDFDRDDGGGHGGEFAPRPGQARDTGERYESTAPANHEPRGMYAEPHAYDEPGASAEQAYGQPMGGRTGDGGPGPERAHDSLAYSVPTREETHDPASMRKPATAGLLALAGFAAFAGLVVFLFVRRRRSKRAKAAGVRDRAKGIVRELRDGVRETIDAAAA
ncbi:MAG TPA: hypothetical protein VFH62_03295 [Dehalococcoidia bacterium]|nr:hypothetical protein [Dehalococcoidia bacterium]